MGRERACLKNTKTHVLTKEVKIRKCAKNEAGRPVNFLIGNLFS